MTDDVESTRAEEKPPALADRSVFTLDSERWDAFVAALDTPPHRLPRLERLFREASVLDP
jgi:uncharacterized protein (DUF1778 family)